MKIVIDTNVLISGLITSGPPARVLNLWLSNKATVCISSQIIEEYLAVILRPKFKGVGTAQERYQIISGLVELGNTQLVNPDFQLEAIVEDPDDNVFLECALEAQAEVIVSGDNHLLNLAEYKEIKILNPSEFLQRYF